MFNPTLNLNVNGSPFASTPSIETPGFALHGRAPLLNRAPIPSTNMMIAQQFKIGTEIPKRKIPRRNSKCKDSDPNKPKRPLSAYNLFFRNERIVLLRSLPVRVQGKPRRSHGKLGFVEMAQIIGYRWKCAHESTKAFYDLLAMKERERYDREMEEYYKRKEANQIDRHQTETCTPFPVSTSKSSNQSNTSDLNTIGDVEPIDYKSNEESNSLQLDNEMIEILRSFC